VSGLAHNQVLAGSTPAPTLGPNYWEENNAEKK
jgi:hypothetical protein